MANERASGKRVWVDVGRRVLNQADEKKKACLIYWESRTGREKLLCSWWRWDGWIEGKARLGVPPDMLTTLSYETWKRTSTTRLVAMFLLPLIYQVPALLTWLCILKISINQHSTMSPSAVTQG